jgi:hypothetical protein
MATLRSGLVDKVKKAAAKVSARGAEVAARAGTRGARALVETTTAAVKTVDKLQARLGRSSSKARAAEKVKAPDSASKPSVAKAATRVQGSTARASPQEAVPSRSSLKEGASAKPRRAATVGAPMAMREAGRKTMPASAPKRSKKAQGPGFKVKRGQKHRHTGR